MSVAPTGAGKTIMFSEIAGRMIRGSKLRVLVLAHRDELTLQNHNQFKLMNPFIETSVYDATTKSWDGQATFAMVPTLSRPENLATMPTIDLLVIDEAHHAVAETYQRIVAKARDLNSKCRIFGVTATPNRSDYRGLREVFSNVADQISVGELIRSGHLVPPRTFVMDVGVQDSLSNVRQQGDEFDMFAVEQIMNQRPINSAVVTEWKSRAEERQTVVFCSTVAHAKSVADEFRRGDIDTVLVTGDMGQKEREEALDQYASGRASVIVNVAVLTEGWDHPPTSCIVLLRPSSAKSTMIQMIGRGLRTVDARRFPGISKTDCLILDFGTSSLIHGTLEQDVQLDSVLTEGMLLSMQCPSCEAEIPLSSSECPICGHEFKKSAQEQEIEREKEPVSSVEMMEINLLDQSHFEWVDLFGDDASLISTGFSAWGGIFYFDGNWNALGGRGSEKAELLTQGSRIVCLASANDWLNQNETEETAYKTQKWLKEPPTQKQIQALPKECRLDFNLTRYRASARMTFEKNKQRIKEVVTASNP